MSARLDRRDRTAARSSFRSLVAATVAFTVAVTAWLGLAGLSTSAFTFTLGPGQLWPIAAVLLAAYIVAGAVALLLRAARPKRRRRPSPDRAVLQAMFALTIWAVLTVTFLPLQGPEGFAGTRGLTTVQLNLIGLAAVVAVGLVFGLLLAMGAEALVDALRRRLRPAAVRVIGVSVCVVALVAAAVGASSHAGTVSALGGGTRDIPRVVIIGVDGCDWERLEPLVAAGRLPTFQRLMSQGVYGPMESLEELVSPRIWTTIATGKDPEKHGILDFVNADGVPVNSTMRRAAPVWTIASAAGATVGVVGWYVTWPVDEVSGFMVSDRVHSLLRGPVQMLQSLEGRPTNERLEAFGGFTFDPAYKSYPKSEKRYQQNRIVDEPLRWGYLRDHIYSEMADRLYPFYRPTFAAVYFRGVDFTEHFFWKYSEPDLFSDVTPQDVRSYGEVITNYYIYQDGLLARLLDSLGEDVNVIVVSDHGFQARTDPPPERPQLTGKHERKAVLIASGPAFASTGRFEGARVEDVAPTALAVMGLPVPDDMDGRVLMETIEPSHLEKYPIHTIASYEPLLGTEREEVGSTMDESIREQLRSLGYIE